MHVQEVSEFGLQEKVFQNLIRRISKELFTIGVFCCNVSYQKVSFQQCDQMAKYYFNTI